MADVQIAIIDQQNTQIALAAPPDTQVTAAVPGVQGPKGEGVPTGGTANQVLFKQSSTNYDTAWGAITSAMIGDLQIVDGDVSTTAAIAGTKISPNFGAQNVVTTGTSTAASFIPTSSSVPTNGLYLPAANSVALSTNGTGRLFVDASGRVGVGTTTPGSYSTYGNKLVIYGTGTDGPGMTIVTGTSDTGSIYFADGTTGNEVARGAVQYAHADDALLFQTAASERLRITSAGNVGIGTASPSAILDVKVASDAKLLVQDGNATGNIKFNAVNNAVSANVNLEISASNTQFFNGGSERARIDSSGRLLVGTSSTSDACTQVLQGYYPGGSAEEAILKLQRGTASPTTSATLGLIQFGSSTGRRGAEIYSQRDGGTWTDGSSHPGRLVFSTTADGASSPTERMRIDSSGRVGIGTASPSYLLDVRRSSAGDVVAFTGSTDGGRPLKFVSADNGIFLGAQWTRDIGSGSGIHAWAINGTERARIDSSGRLLVGTSSAVADASSLLQISSAGGPKLALNLQDGTVISGQFAASIDFYSFGGFVNESIASIQAFADDAHASGDKPGRLVFSTTADGASSPTERMSIDNAGYIFPDVTSRTASNSIQATGAPGFRIISASTTSTVRCECFTNTTTLKYAIAFSNPNGIVGSISTSGSATAYNTSSDYRLKENVTPVTDGITRLQQLKPSRFNFIADPGKTVDGFIAHEAQTVVPEAITGEKDAVDDEGNPQYQGIDQSKLVPLLTAALQEAVAKIESLEARLTAAGL